MKSPTLAVQSPGVYAADLNAEQLSALFCDIESCGQVREILVKREPTHHVHPDESVSLRQGRRQLENGSILALQIRYAFGSAVWWDTLLRRPTGIALVRIQAPSS